MGSCETGCLDFDTKEQFTSTLGVEVGRFWTEPGVYSYSLNWMGAAHEVCPYGCRFEHEGDAGPQFPAWRHCRPSVNVVAPCSRKDAELHRPERLVPKALLMHPNVLLGS